MSKHLVETDIHNQAVVAADLLAVIADQVIDDEQTAADMIEGETGLFEALDRALDEIRNCDVISAGCAEVIGKLEARKRRADNRKAVIRAAIEQAMQRIDVKTLQLPTATLSVSVRAGVAIVSEMSEIPAKFFKAQDPKLDKKALTDALRDGEAVPGAHLGNGTLSLTIREK